MCDPNCHRPVAHRRHSVCILSGSFGEGHDAAAREIKRRLADHGIDAVILDIVQQYPLHLGALFKRIYLWQMKHVPRTWRWLLAQLQASGGAAELESRGRRWAAQVALGAIGTAARRLRPVPQMFDAVISTHPFASQAIGRLVGQGRMPQQASVTYLTDLSVHPLWISPLVGSHLALHPVAATDAADLGARDVHVVRPALRPVSRAPGEESPRSTAVALPPRLPGGDPRVAARLALDLPTAGRLALVTGGAEGVGDLERAALDILAAGGITPVVLCARNQTLRRRLARDPRIIALGWVSDMASLYAAVDVVVQNAGGSTSLEALAAGVPVLSYRCLPGHGETNAANLERAGLVPWVRAPEDLGPALDRASVEHPPPLTGRCVAAVIAEALAAA